jgi:ribosomal protein L37AE/L43A
MFFCPETTKLIKYRELCGLPFFRCEKCERRLAGPACFAYNYCPYCGRKITEVEVD